MFNGSRIPVALAVGFSVTCLLVAGATGAVAQQLITGKDIANGTVTGKNVKDKTITGIDIRDGSIKVRTWPHHSPASRAQRARRDRLDLLGRLGRRESRTLRASTEQREALTPFEPGRSPSPRTAREGAELALRP